MALLRVLSLVIALVLALQLSDTTTEASSAGRHHPPIYTIQTSADLRDKLDHHQLIRWNNQRLEVREHPLRYSDEPEPYYHSYKMMAHPAQVQQQTKLGRGRPRQGHKVARAPGATKGGSSRYPAQAASSPAISRRMGTNSKPGLNSTRTRAGQAKKNLVCYYGTWAVYRPDAGKYPVENIDPFLCTHIIYGFTGLSYDNLIKPLDPWNDLEDNYGKGAMKRFTNLKRINPDLKTLVAIGGWNEGSIKYSKMASEPASRAQFVTSVVDFLKKYNFDGLDLDWEYPGARGGYSYDKQNFVKLLQELKRAFEPNNYLLTAAVSAGKWFIDPAYDIPQVAKYLDLINLMAYDYHGGWETKTGMNAPLFSSPKHDLKDERLLNVNWSVNYWLQQGAPPEKIMLGVGSYGRSFTLDRAEQNGINAPASQKGRAGPYTREPGSLGYNEICEAFMKQPNSWTIVRDPDYLTPYAYNKERQWVGYDDMESLALKAQYARSMGLGGMMMWSIETDDFLGKCHNEKYPLLNTVKRVMNEGGRPNSGYSTTRRPPISPVAPTGTSRRPSSSTSSTTPGREIEDEVITSSSSTTSTRRPTTPRVSPSSSRRPSSSLPSTKPRPDPPSTSRPTGSTSTSTRTTSAPSTSGRPPKPPADTGEFVCRADGMFSDPQNCRKFIRCVSAGSMYTLFRFDCAPGTAFNEQFQYCDHIYNVPSCSQAKTTADGSDQYNHSMAVGRSPPMVFYW